MNFDQHNVLSVKTDVKNCVLSPMQDYHVLKNSTHLLNVKGNHLANLDALTHGGTQFSENAVSLSLGSALKLSNPLGSMPLLDNGNMSLDGVKRQYSDVRYAFQLNARFLAGYDNKGFITIAGYTENGNVVNGHIDGRMLFRINTITIYTLVPDNKGGVRPVLAYTGRVLGNKPLTPVFGSNNQQGLPGTSFGNSLSSFSGFNPQGEAPVSNESGVISSQTIGSQIAHEVSLHGINNNDGHTPRVTIDTGLQSNFTGNSFDNASSTRLVSGLLNGYNKAATTKTSDITGNYGTWVDDEETYGSDSGNNVLSQIWQLAALNNSTDTNLTSNHVIGELIKVAPNLPQDGWISWRALNSVFPNLDSRTDVLTDNLHQEHFKLFSMPNNPANHNNGTLEAELARQVVQYVPSFISGFGFERFGFMATNQTNQSFGSQGNKDSVTPNANILHPYLNRNCQALNEAIKGVLDSFVLEVAPFLGDHGHRKYRLEVNYNVRGDVRVSIDIGAGRKDFNLVVSYDSGSAASVSFNANVNRRDLANSIESIKNELGDPLNQINSGGVKPTSFSFANKPDTTGWNKQPSFGSFK